MIYNSAMETKRVSCVELVASLMWCFVVCSMFLLILDLPGYAATGKKTRTKKCDLKTLLRRIEEDGLLEGVLNEEQVRVQKKISDLKSKDPDQKMSCRTMRMYEDALRSEDDEEEEDEGEGDDSVGNGQVEKEGDVGIGGDALSGIESEHKELEETKENSQEKEEKEDGNENEEEMGNIIDEEKSEIAHETESEDESVEVDAKKLSSDKESEEKSEETKEEENDPTEEDDPTEGGEEEPKVEKMSDETNENITDQEEKVQHSDSKDIKEERVQKVEQKTKPNEPKDEQEQQEEQNQQNQQQDQQQQEQNQQHHQQDQKQDEQQQPDEIQQQKDQNTATKVGEAIEGESSTPKKKCRRRRFHHYFMTTTSGFCRKKTELKVETEKEEPKKEGGLLKTLWNSWTGIDEDKMKVVKEKTQSIDMALMEKMLSTTSEKYQKQIQDLELQVLRVENQLLSKSIHKQERSAHYANLENQLLRLENEILKFNQTFTEMRTETLKLQTQQQTQANDLAIVKGKAVSPPENGLIGVNDSFIYDIIKKHEEQIQNLTESLDDQAKLVFKLQEKSSNIETQNKDLVNKLLDQDTLMNDVMKKLDNITQRQLEHKNEVDQSLTQLKMKYDESGKTPGQELGQEEGKDEVVEEKGNKSVDQQKRKDEERKDEENERSEEEKQEDDEQSEQKKSKKNVKEDKENEKNKEALDEKNNEDKDKTGDINNENKREETSNSEEKKEEMEKENKESEDKQQKEKKNSTKENNEEEKKKKNKENEATKIENENMKIENNKKLNKKSKNEKKTGEKQEVKKETKEKKPEFQIPKKPRYRHPHPHFVTDCYDALQQGRRFDMPMKIRPAGMHRDITAFCDMTRGGWTVFQRRVDGSTNFQRKWLDYKRGFVGRKGVQGEYWLGLEKIHHITNQGNYKLRVELLDWGGNSRYAQYDYFMVESERQGYKLHVMGYSGDAGDSLSKHDGQKFSTFDKDNDLAEPNYPSGSCAKRFSGAWWYYKCYSSNLNGKFYQGGEVPGKGFDGVAWKAWTGPKYSLKKVEMKIKPVKAR